jgi:uncharacterized protein YjbI with pentapeptide repeats
MSSLGRVFVPRLCAVLVAPLAVLAIVQAPSASARTINGCEIVDHPTPDHRTNCPGADLFAADLSGADLSGADLSGANLGWAGLPGANLTGANLSHADLPKANLNRANLSHADLSSAALYHALLARVDLSGANLLGAGLSPGGLNVSRLCGTIMPDGSTNNRDCNGLGAKPPARVINGCQIVEYPTDYDHTDCPGAHLSHADLSGLNLTYADLSGANLSGANLRYADLTADLSDADLSGADLTGANLYRALLDGAELTGAITTDAYFCRTSMPNGSTNNANCPPGARPPMSRSKTFVLPANSTKTFDVGYPSALKYRRARYFCDALVSGRGKRFVKILSRRSARGGTVCRVRARNTAKLPSLDTTAKVKVIATTVR